MAINMEKDYLKTPQKLYPIFYQSPSREKVEKPIRKRKKSIGNGSMIMTRPHTRRKVTEQQLHLDLGQKSFGHVQCSECGMVYTNGQMQDVRDHCKFHKTRNTAISFKGWKDERVIERFVDGRVLVVLSSDSKQHKKKVEEILSVIDRELGYTTATCSGFKCSSKSFLFVSNTKEVTGYILAEEVTKAYQMTESEEYKENDPSLSSQDSCCSYSDIPSDAGIARVWVHPSNRRNGVATRLLDAVRKHFIYGYTIPKTSLAFSDPSADGRALAMSYCGSRTMLVYKWMP